MKEKFENKTMTAKIKPPRVADHASFDMVPLVKEKFKERNKLMEEKKLKWISVNDSLPKIDEEVFVYGKEIPQDYGNGTRCLFPPTTRIWQTKRAEKPSQHTDGNGFWRIYGFGIYEITHWFPIPSFDE